jgi:hypothetical protein
MSTSTIEEKPRELTGKFIYLAMLCSSPVLLIFIYLGRTDQGFGASASAAVVLLAMRSSWNLRKHVWFWVAIALVVLIQVPIVLLIPWGGKGINGRGVFPIALLNGGISYGLLKLADIAIRRRAPFGK